MRYETNDIQPSLEVLDSIAQNLSIPSNFLYDEYYSFLAYPYSQKIKEIRVKYGLTRLELAEKLNINIRTIERWENKSHIINREYYFKLKTLCFT